MSPSSALRSLVIAFVVLLLASTAFAQTPTLVKDINPGFSGSSPFYAVEMNGVLYFGASDSTGRELWRSDGTAAGTWQVRDINPGFASSDPDTFTVAGDKLFFYANDGTHGKELWVSDGTNAGTFLLQDVRPGTATSIPGSNGPPLAGFNGKAYFIADNGVIGQELWISDGTTAGTQLFKEFNPTGHGCFRIAVAGGQIWLNAVKDNLGGELWRSDGTLAGTVFVADVHTAEGVGSSPNGFTAVNGIVYFSAQASLVGTELFRTDGTAAGTYMVKEIALANNSGFTWSSHPSNLTAAGNYLFFTADDKVAPEGTDLYRTDGTQAGTIKLPLSTSGSSSIGQLVNLNGTLLAFHTISSSQAQLWKSDGTPAGTTQIWSGTAGNQAPRGLMVADGRAFFYAGELMRSDGTAAGTTLHADFWAGGVSHAFPLEDVNGRMYCSASNGSIGSELWSVATCGTSVPKPAITPSGPTSLCAGGSVTLTASAGSSYLWSTGATTQQITVTAAGSYTVTVGNGEGCAATSDPIEVTVAQPPSITFDRPAVCPDGEATASVPSTYSEYNWTITNGIILSGEGTHTVLFEPAGPLEEVTLSIQVRDAQSCEASTYATIPYKNIDPPALTFDRPAMCPDGEASASVPDSYSYYSWSITNGIILSGEGTHTVVFEAIGPGEEVTLSVEVRDSESCRAYTSGSIPFKSIDPPVLTFDRPAVCPDGQASASVPDSYSYYSWYITNGVILSGEGTHTVVFEPSGPGENVTLSVEVSDSESCRAYTSGSIPFKSIEPPVLTFDRPAVCPDGQASASVPDSYSYYSWYITNGVILSGEGSHTVVFEPSGPGENVTLSVEVRDSESCRAYTSGSIPFKSIEPPAIAFGQTSACPEGTNTASVPASYSNYTWYITNGTIVSGPGTNSVVFQASGNDAVTLSVEVSDSESCRAYSSATLPLRTPPAITVDGPSTFCAGSSTTLTATSGASYLWSTGATTQSIVVTAAGSYSVTVTDANGCAATSAPVSVTVADAPATPVVTASGPTTFCDGGNVTLTAPDGYTYLWSNGATTRSVTVTASGNYSVTVTNAAGCSATSTATQVTAYAGPSGFISDGQFDACAGQPYAIQGEIVGNGNPVDVLWSDGFVQHVEHPAHFSRWVVPPAGTSTWSVVSVTDDLGCTRTGTVTGTATLTTLPAPVAGIQGVVPYSEGASSSEIVSQANGVIEVCGDGPIDLIPAARDLSYTYLWAHGDHSPVARVTESGEYTLTVTAPNGCATTTTVTVHFSDYPAKPSVTVPATELCPAGGSITLTASAAEGWLWSTGATTQSIVVTAPGTYSVRARENLCYSQPSNPVVISAGTSSISTSDSLAICPGSSATLTANAGTSWLWSNGATTRSIMVTEPGSYSVTTTNGGCTMAESAPVTVTRRAVVVTPAGPTTFCSGESVRLDAEGGTSWLWSTGAVTPYLYVTEPGAYTVTATYADGCSVTSDPVVIDVRNPVATITADQTAVCPGAPIHFESSVTGTGSFTYQWYDSTNQPLEGETSATLTYTPSVSAGYVYLEVTDEIGCSDTSNAIVFSVYDNPDATITPLGETTFCEGGSVTLQASEGAAYSWSTGATTREITVSASGTYSVTVTGASCGETSDASITVMVTPLPDATMTALGPTTFCEGGSVTLRAPEAASYSWSNGATMREITVSASGSYSVTVTNANGCSATSSATSVTVNPLPAATVTALGATTFCEDGSVTLRASEGTSYLWSNGATTRDVTVSASGSYSVTVTNANGCSATSSATSVTVNPLPAATVTALGATTFCEGGSVTLRASEGTSYLWSNGATTRDITVSASGNYSVTVTNANGCSATSSATSVMVNPLPTATVTPLGATTFCEGGSVTLRASEGTSYLWSNGATTRDITVSASGNYSVTVTNANGCSATSSATTVTVNPLPAATVTALGATAFCEGGSVTLRASEGTSYLWSNGATTRDITVSASGNYSVTVTNANGCSATSSATAVTVNPLPAATVTALGATTFCEGGSVTLRASEGTSYLWSNGATTRDITVTASGNYSVTVTNANGCSATSSPTTVTVNPPPAATVTPLSTTTFCEGGSVTLRASAGTSYLWSN
ncbi:MAG TPA: ELWxxDGT repeat protein, partial [Thermoanaerobaculia bacterium]